MFLFQILLCLRGKKQDSVAMCLFCCVIAEGGSAHVLRAFEVGRTILVCYVVLTYRLAMVHNAILEFL